MIFSRCAYTLFLLQSNFSVIGSEEYCEEETFVAKCANDEVIIVNKAMFGRLKIGKCISESLAFFMECSVNVLNFMESQCSGRGACSMPVALLITKGFKNCTSQLASYLEVDYSCIRGDLNPIKLCNWC